MDDSCAVCAESLEWVAYGSCGHREVCSTCVVRLRFVLEDRRCCICKTESPSVFVTKAMGDYTRTVTDFAVFPASASEGKVGSYWYHEGSQAYFDDADHYRMIKAMCRLSCSICDKSAEEQGIESTKRRNRFRNIDQLKGHLYHQHRKFMCNLCLEGRKVFISEQKLYTKPQLYQHIRNGDSEVDGSESERGGFMGHPMCEFCRNPFYGDNELYTHMSTEHYTCHICQRQHPGQYDYFRNYDDLESHFRQEHFLCEDESCLAKKFIVFQTEAEMKRHNTIEHGGNMSRSQRNAALQIPTSFRYRRSTDHEQRQGRGRGFRPDPSNSQLSMAIQASIETAIADSMPRDSSGSHPEDTGIGSSESSTVSSTSEASTGVHTLEGSHFPPLSVRDPPATSSRYAQALNQVVAAKLGEELFPPLPGSKENNKSKQELEGLGSSNTLASRLNRGKGTVKVLNPGRPRASETNELGPSNSANFPQLRPIQNQASTTLTSSLGVGFPHLRPLQNQAPTTSSSSFGLTFPQLRPIQNQASTTSSSSFGASFPQLRPVQNQNPTSSTSNFKPHATTRGNGFVSPISTSTLWTSVNGNKMKHSLSAPDLTEPATKQGLPSIEDVHTANKSLVERIRIGLKNDEDKFAAFKSISSEYRDGQINTWEYISCVEQFGLMHLVLELARLCPDRQKQQELIDAYNANIQNQGLGKNGENETESSTAGNNRRRKGKGKGKNIAQADDATNGKNELANNFLETVRKLQLSGKNQEEQQVEVLSKDGYRGANSISKSSANLNLVDSSQNSGSGGGGDSSKPRRKTSKFHRLRLGDDFESANASPEHSVEETGNQPSESIPVRGVWKSRGGQKLFSDSQPRK